MATRRLTSPLLAVALACTASAAVAAVRSSPETAAITARGTTSIALAARSGPPAGTAASMRFPSHEAMRDAMLNQFVNARRAGLSAAAAAGAATLLSDPPPPLPHVTGLPLSENEESFGFQGLSAVDSGNVNGYDNEPPDQMLCVGNGYVFEGVNSAVAVYNQHGQLVAGPAAINAFFGIDPSINLSDPRCIYDSGSNRWFVTVTRYNNNFTDNHIPLAVSQSGDPTGAFNVYDINVTNDGSDFLVGDCPCLGDQPLIGADANGFYISTNAYGVLSFEGAQIYALSKSDLAAGKPSPAAVHFDQLSAVLAAALPPTSFEFSFSIQPSTTTPGTPFAANTEFLAQSMRGLPQEAQLAVWTINNTQLINSNPAGLSMSLALTPSEVYVTPVFAKQKVGPTPLAEIAAIDPTAAGPANEQDLAADDQRLQQLTYRNGQLWTTVDTAAVSSGTPVRDAAAWFVLDVTNGSGGPTASIAAQGYVAGPGASHLLYPAIVVNARGNAAVVFTLTGPQFFPSAAYWPFGAQSLKVLSSGRAAEDGFAAYYFNSPRWGDYSATAVSADGSLWMATELIPGPRNTFANWGTFVTRVGGRD